MKKISALLLTILAPAFGAYRYYYSDPLNVIDPARWAQSGPLAAGSAGLSSAATEGGLLLSRISVPDGSCWLLP